MVLTTLPPRLRRNALHEIRGAFELIVGVSRVRHHETGEWSVDVRTHDRQTTVNEIAARLEEAGLDLPGHVVTVGVVTELLSQWRAERLFRGVVFVQRRQDVAETRPGAEAVAPVDRGGDLPAPSEEAR